MASILTKLFLDIEQAQPDLIEEIPSRTETVCDVNQIPGSSGTSTTSLVAVDENAQQSTYGATYTEINGQVYELVNNQLTPVIPGTTYLSCRTVRIPAKTITTPRPPLNITQPDIGWTGSALSSEFIPENGELIFSVKSNVTGAVVGLNQYEGGTEGGYFDIDFGFIFTQGNVSVIENNVTGQVIGSFATDDIFSVRRVNRVILYFRNDILVYKSELDGGIEALYADASLYMSGDQVLNAEINLNVVDEVFVTNVVIPSVSSMVVGSIRIDDEVFVQATSLDSVSAMSETRFAILGVQSIDSVSTLTSTVNPLSGNANALPAFQSFAADRNTGQGVATFQALESSGVANSITINVGFSTSVMGAITSQGVMLTGGNNLDEVQSLQALTGTASDHPYSESINELRAFQAIAGAYPERMVGAARLIDQITRVQGSSILLWTGRHLLTAAHVAEKWTNFEAVDIDFISDDGVNLPTYKPYRVSVHPDWNPTRDANGTAIGNFLNDIAIVEIAQYVDPFVGRHFLYTDEDELGQVFDKTSYSPRIHPETGAVSPSGWDTISNQYDLVEQGYLRYDFDNGQSINDFFTSTGTKVVNEGFVSPGDSGGGSLINNKVAGILSFVQGFTGLPDILPGTNFTYGEVAADIRVSAYDNWITAQAIVTSPLYGVDPAIPEIQVQLRPAFSQTNIDLLEFDVNARGAGTINNAGNIDLLAFDIQAYGGANVGIDLLEFDIASTGTVSDLATVNIDLLEFDISSNVLAGGFANADLDLLLAFDIQAYGGANVGIDLLEFDIVSTATAIGKADVSIDLLEFDIASTVTSRTLNTVNIDLLEFDLIWGRVNIPLIEFDITAFDAASSNSRIINDGMGEAYSMNVVHSEITRYSNYDFDRIVRWQGKYYGIKSDGLYLLEGDKDINVNINAVITTSMMDFGTAVHKRMPYVYLNTTDPTNIQSYTDEELVGKYPSNFNGRRTKLARGAKGRFWSFDVENVQGGDMDLRSLELYPSVISRKV